MVIIVEAGAVAEASAASTTENASSRCSTKYVSTNTSTDASTASNTVIHTTRIPLRLSTSSLKNSPVENAMNASAMSDRKSVPSMIRCGTRSRQYGPSRMPARIYAVTFGSRSSFVSRVIKKPEKSISAMEMITDATGR